MRRIALAGALVAGVVAVPAAQAHHGQDGRSGDVHQQHSGWHHHRGHHRVWFAAGTVVSQTLAKNDDGTYSGDVTIEAKRWDRRRAKHREGASDEQTTEQKTFTLDHARAKFHVSDTEPADGKIDESDVVAGDRVLLAGKSVRHGQCDGHDSHGKVRAAHHDMSGDSGDSGKASRIRWALFADPKTDEAKGSKRR
jgi:hypothetical protein